MRPHDPAADGQAHARPLGSPAAALEPVELVEDPLPLRDRDAGPWSTTRSSTVSPAWRATTWTGRRRRSRGRCRAGWSAPGRGGPGRPAPGQLVGHVHVDPLPRRGPGPAHHRADHLGDRALDQVGVERPGLDAGHVEQVVDQPGEPVDLGVDGDQELVLLGVAPRTSWSSRLEAEALIEASGVRRSWETELSRAVRSRSVSCRARARLRCSSCWPCSTASAAWLAKVARTRRSASPNPEESGPPATTTSAPTTSPLRMGTVRARPGSRSAPAGPPS